MRKGLPCLSPLELNQEVGSTIVRLWRRVTSTKIYLLVRPRHAELELQRSAARRAGHARNDLGHQVVGSGSLDQLVEVEFVEMPAARRLAVAVDRQVVLLDCRKCPGRPSFRLVTLVRGLYPPPQNHAGGRQPAQTAHRPLYVGFLFSLKALMPSWR